MQSNFFVFFKCPPHVRWAYVSSSLQLDLLASLFLRRLLFPQSVTVEAHHPLFIRGIDPFAPLTLAVSVD